MNERQIVHVNNGSLVLRKILQSDAGVYNCTVLATNMINNNFKSNNNNKMNGRGAFHSENNKKSRQRKIKNSEKENHELSVSHDGRNSASSSMRIKVIGKKSLSYYP